MTSILDEVLERVNILDVVSQYIKLRRTGRNFIGLCPFHKEKTPSFTVNPEKQIFYCFGCHQGGNAVHFLSKYEHLPFQEALEILARQAGINVRKRTGTTRTPILDALSALCDYYRRNLKQSSLALKYLAARNIDSKVIEEFKLGFSERKSYSRDLSKRLGIPLDMLFSAGILKMKDGGEIYDIFRGRVVVPIMDIGGKVIGFGGRALGKEVLPKYINSPESPIFTKRSVLYGLDKAKREIPEKDEAIIVEGYFDLISLHAAGVRNAVATLGTSITEEQITRLRNYTENITLMLDGDEAGIKSALRLITLFGEMGINGNMVVLPDGHDPDTFIRQNGLDGFTKVMKEKRPLLDYFFALHIKKHGVRTLEGRLSFIRAVVPYIEAMKDTVKRRVYVQRLSEVTGVEEYRFWDTLRERRMEHESRKEESRSVIEEKVVGVLMNKPELIQLFQGRGVEGHIRDRELSDLLSKMLEYHEQSTPLDIKFFVNLLEKEGLREKALRAAMDVSDYDEEEMKKVVTDYLLYVENKLIREEAKKIREGVEEAEKRGDEKALEELLERMRKMLTVMKYKSAK